MFDRSAKFYDLIYSFKNYQDEAEQIKKYIEAMIPDCKSILDVACGTGEHDKYLKSYYNIDGIDINDDFLSIAKTKNPTGHYFSCDMKNFHMDKKYDAVICLFSSIGYLKTIDHVQKALVCFNEHLNDHGVVLVEPWFTPDSYGGGGRLGSLSYEKDGVKVCRMSITDSMGGLTFHYLVGSKEDGIRHYEEIHELGLFSIDEMKHAFDTAGFTVEHEPKGISGRGMYIGRKKVV